MSTNGERRVDRLPVSTLANGHVLELTVHRVQGTAIGPRLALVAGIHGDEPLGAEIVRRTLLAIADLPFRGELVAIPVANPCAFATSTRNTPIDAANLNRTFPGNPDGTLTEQLAHVVVTELSGSCDALIDLHSGGTFATVDYVYLSGDEAFAKAFGCELLYRGSSPIGSLAGHLAGTGVESLIVELGGGQQLNDHFVGKGVLGITNAMKYLDMLDGTPELPAQQLVFTELADLKPHAGGLMLSRFGPERLGEAVPVGTELARVVSPYTFEILDSIVAPFDPTLLVLVRESVSRIESGDYGFIVANGAGAVPA